MSKTSKKAHGVRPAVRLEKLIFPSQDDPMAGVNGRVLVGWMSVPQLNAFIAAFADGQDEVARLTRAAEIQRIAVARLDRRLDQAGVISDVPDRLAAYVSLFDQSAVGKVAAAEGFKVGLIDLTKVVAFQTFVRLGSVRNYSLLVNPGDVAGAARIALPIDFRSEVRARFNPHTGAWHVLSLDQNLRAVGQIGHPNADGTITVGFSFAIQPSLVKVQSYKGRAYLSDGYHRTVGLLRRGFRESLALVKEVGEFEQLGAIGHLPIDAFTGDTPPLLSDYSNDALSMDLKVPGGSPRHFLLRPQQLS